jgi:hypothetical protein
MEERGDEEEEKGGRDEMFAIGGCFSVFFFSSSRVAVLARPDPVLGPPGAQRARRYHFFFSVNPFITITSLYSTYPKK